MSAKSKVNSFDDPVEEPKAEPKVEPKAEPKVEPKAEPIETVLVGEYLPEAGGVCWTELFGIKKEGEIEHVVKINLTARGFTAEAALRSLLEAMAVARDEFKLRPYLPTKESPASKPPAQAPTQAPAQAGPPLPQEPTYEDIPGTPINGTFVCVRMTATPRTDGKTKLDFYEASHQFPDVSAVMTPVQLAEMLSVVAAWTPEHFQSVAEYKLNPPYKVQWRNSDRLNRNGKPYKNIVGIGL